MLNETMIRFSKGRAKTRGEKVSLAQAASDIIV